MKIALLLYLAKITNEFQYQQEHEFTYLLKCFVITLIPSILVFLEPDTGAIIFYLILLFSVLLLSNIKKKWFAIAFFLFFLLGSGFFYLYFFKQDYLINLIGTSFFYRMDRLIHFNDGTSLQLENALTTIGNAGWFGKGIQKQLLYVPEFPTDFVFTLYLSIFGFTGGLILLMAFFLLNLFFTYKFFNCKNFLYKIFIHGFLFLFLFQQIENIFMNMGLLPIMGIPLPFLSYGGSNMIVYFLFIGLIFNMSKKTT